MDLNTKINKEKKSRRGHVACRKEGGSFLLFKIRLRVIHKKRKTEKMRDFRVRSSHFSLDFRRSDHRFPAKQEGKSFLVIRAAS